MYILIFLFFYIIKKIAHQLARHSSEKLSMTRILILFQILSTFIFNTAVFSSTLMNMGVLV